MRETQKESNPKRILPFTVRIWINKTRREWEKFFDSAHYSTSFRLLWVCVLLLPDPTHTPIWLLCLSLGIYDFHVWPLIHSFIHVFAWASVIRRYARKKERNHSFCIKEILLQRLFFKSVCNSILFISKSHFAVCTVLYTHKQAN